MNPAREDWRYRFYFPGEVGAVRVNEGWGRISFQTRAAGKAGPHCANSPAPTLRKKRAKDGAPTALLCQRKAGPPAGIPPLRTERARMGHPSKNTVLFRDTMLKTHSLRQPRIQGTHCCLT